MKDLVKVTPDEIAALNEANGGEISNRLAGAIKEVIKSQVEAALEGQVKRTPQVFDWGNLGVDETGTPAHMPMGINDQGQGPVPDSEADLFVCWCCDINCPLTQALLEARRSGMREEKLREFEAQHVE